MSDIAVRDMRRTGFSWLGNAEMRTLRAEFEGRERTPALALYTTMVEAANAVRGDAFKASRSRLGKAAGMSPRSVDTYAERLVAIGLLRVEETPGRPNTWVLTSAPDPRNAEHSPLATPDTPPSQRGAPVKEEGGETEKKSPKSPSEEPIGFSEWLGRHVELAGFYGVEQSVPRAGTSNRATLAATFGALVAEGYPAEEFELASEGVLSSEFMREGGHVKPENVLRKTKFAGKVDDGRRARAKRLEGDGRGEGQGPDKWGDTGE